MSREVVAPRALPSDHAGMSTTGERMLRVLDVVEAGPASMSFEQVHDALGYTRSTLYRYLKTLTDADQGYRRK